MPGTVTPDSRASDHLMVRMCCHCHRIRGASGEWRNQTATPAGRVTHGICKVCFVTYYPEVPPPAELA